MNSEETREMSLGKLKPQGNINLINPYVTLCLQIMY